jgi:glutathione S-transferase
MSYILAIGDRSYSSWSLRAWLSFARFEIPVEIRTAVLYTPDFPALLAEEFGAARTVPALHITGDGEDFKLWDTLAIAETLAERHPDRGLWPAETAARALARSLVAEMHSSFLSLRSA